MQSLAKTFVVSGFLLVWVTLGCGGPSGPKLDPKKQATITGIAIFEGKPIPVESGIHFYNSEADITAAGRVDATGKFTVKAADPRKGLPAGKYKVTIHLPGAAPISSKDAKYNEAMLKSMKPAPPVQAASAIPVRFTSLEKSKIVREVKPGPNSFEIDLSKEP